MNINNRKLILKKQILLKDFLILVLLIKYNWFNSITIELNYK